MRRKCYVLLLMLLASINIISCKQNKTKNTKSNQKSVQNDSEAERAKRSIDDEEEKPFWANRGKKQSEEDDDSPNSLDFEQKSKQFRSDKIDKEPPFWGNRGRRDSSEEIDGFIDSKTYDKPKFCAHCKSNNLRLRDYLDFSKERRDEMDPFWGNRGRRQEDDPFWGTRGRREELPFWGNRGRRENLFRDQWGRLRNEDENPFWGNRGRRDEVEPFWGNRGRRYLTEPIIESINNAGDNRNNIYNTKQSYWKNNDRESTMKYLFDGVPRTRLGQIKKTNDMLSAGANTVLDDRIYAEQPHFILVERSSRSSSEDDPYFISRGKKHTRLDWDKIARYRRTTIKDLFNSVKSDPYFIARGKKDGVRFQNSTLPYDEIKKTKELICATIDLMLRKNNDEKRSIDDSDRGRRAVLQKLAAQLQSDPYFVSRGKKDYDSEESVAEFVSELKAMCY